MNGIFKITFRIFQPLRARVKTSLHEAFAVELFGFIEKWGPASWIYGHHHANIPAFQIGQTKMVTNQLGYVHHGENRTFRRDLIEHQFTEEELKLLEERTAKRLSGEGKLHTWKDVKDSGSWVS